MQRVRHAMLVEDLLRLPVGTRVFGDAEVVITSVSGVIESLDDGARYIRWADGHLTVPLGRVRDADQCVAEHTHLAPPQSYRVICGRASEEASRDEERNKAPDDFDKQSPNPWMN
jgi:hypothetical protein